VFPEWKVNSEFIADHLNDALALDAKLSSHPIEVDCPDANHINQVGHLTMSYIHTDLSVRSLMRFLTPRLPRVCIFNGQVIDFNQAYIALRMLSDYVGEERFLKGVSLYLKKKLFANSVTHDLWEGISAATDLNITQLMENWITKVIF
jgi:aminopeptidase 2